MSILISVFTFYYLFFASFFVTSPFNVTEYERQIELFSSELVLGETPTRSDAQKRAVEVWREHFGSQIYFEWPYVVSFDEESDVWLVRGTMAVPPLPRFLVSKFFVGNVPNILIQKSDGRVLAVWRG